MIEFDNFKTSKNEKTSILRVPNIPYYVIFGWERIKIGENKLTYEF